MRSPWMLLVEDDADHEALALRALRKAGLTTEVVVAHTGPEAFECLSGPPENREPVPRVVLLDLKLPGMSGAEVLRRLRATPAHATLPVVVLTSSDEQSDLDQCYELGASSYIIKPVDYDRFVDVIRLVATYWLSLNQIAWG